MHIDPKEVSVIVQGPVVGDAQAPPSVRFTHRCIESARQCLPGAQIILSTYHGSDVRGLGYDVLVENDDPGAVLQNDVRRIPNNVNRQIVTTRNGLRAADRRFALKLRSDLLLEGAGWLTHFGSYPRRCREWRIFEERLINCTVFARNPRSLCWFPFHPSDWLYFGLRDDVMRLWDIRLAPEPETSRWFERRPRPEPDAVPTNLCRYVPEQYIWTTCLRKYGVLDFEHCHDYSGNAVELTELTFANNLILLDPRQLKMHCLTHSLGWRDWCTLYGHTDWLLMYRRLCGCPEHKLLSRSQRVKRWMWLCSLPALKAARWGQLQRRAKCSRAA